MPKPNQKAKWRDSQKPGDFSGIRDRVNNLSAYKGEYRNVSTGMYTVGVLKGRSGIDRDTMRALDFRQYVQDESTRPSRDEIIGAYKAYNQQYANVPDNRIIVMRSRPRIDFNVQGQLAQPLSSKTQQTLVRDFVASLKNLKSQRTITVKNIADLVARSTYSPTDNTLNNLSSAELKHREAQKQQQTPLLSAILGAYIKRPDRGSGVYPLQVLPDVADLRQWGTAVENSVAIDFGEVVAPVALVTGNATGNAVRLSREMLGATTSELMRGATIHFNAGAGDQLYDSFIEYRGKVVGLSSKGHVAGAPASAGTSISSLGHAINEVKASPAALKRLKPLLRDPQNKRMFDTISILADEAGHGLKWDKTLRILNLIDRAYNTTDMYSDIRHIKTLSTDERANMKRLTGGLSQYIRDKISAASARRKEDSSAFAKFLRAANTEITTALNSDPRFSEVCTWVLNHSNTVQIDLYTSKSTVKEARGRVGPDYGGALVVTNIVATWPSTRVDTVKLLENVTDLRFMLGVNGYEQQFPDRAKMPWVDTDFRDQIRPKGGDRADSELKSAGDWRERGIDQPRTFVDTPGVRNVANPQNIIAAPARDPGAGRRPRQPRQQGAAQQPQHAAYSAVRDFLVKHHIGDASGTAASAYRFAIKIIDGTVGGDLAAIAADFRTLMSSDAVRQLVQRETVDTIKHPAGIVSEAQYTPESAVQAITLIYWALTFTRYLETAQQNPEVLASAQFTQVYNTLRDYGTRVIRDGGTQRRFLSSLERAIKAHQPQ